MLDLDNSHKESLLQYLWILIGNIFPIMLGLLIFALPDISWKGWKIFVKDGQFYIYSVTLLTSAIYVFWTFKVQNLDKYALYLYFSIIIAGITSLFYAFFLAGTLTNYIFIRDTSILAFLITLHIFYKSIVMNSNKLDVHEAQKRNIQDIASQLS